MIISFFSKVTDGIDEGTALFIPMDGILVEHAQEISSFEAFFGRNRSNEIELNNIINIIKLLLKIRKFLL